jgi:nitrile hydratase accessory protein
MRFDPDDAAGPPRANGELVFEAPWEARLFGITMALCDAGDLDYEEFRRHLIDEIGAFDRAPDSRGPYRYYACWLAALEHALADRSLCARELLDSRAAALAARPAGHDHDPGSPGHDHDH